MLAVIADDGFGTFRVLIGHKAISVVDLRLLRLQREQDVNNFAELLKVAPELFFLADPKSLG